MTMTMTMNSTYALSDLNLMGEKGGAGDSVIRGCGKGRFFSDSSSDLSFLMQGLSFFSIVVEDRLW